MTKNKHKYNNPYSIKLYNLFYLSAYDYRFNLKLSRSNKLYIEYPNGEEELIKEEEVKNNKGSELIFLEYLNGISKTKINKGE